MVIKFCKVNNANKMLSNTEMMAILSQVDFNPKYVYLKEFKKGNLVSFEPCVKSYGAVAILTVTYGG